MGIVELVNTLDSVQHIESVSDRKWFKPEYQHLLVELDCLNISICYRTVEVSVLGHFQPKSMHAIKDVILRTRRLCWHDNKHNRCLKALSIILS